LDILFFCQLYPPAIFGGGEYIFFQWAKELSKRGHRVISIAQKLDGTLDSECIDGISVFRTGSSISYEGGLPITVKSNFDFLSKSILKGLAIGSNNHIDIIHSNTFVPAMSGFSCGIFLKRGSFWSKWGSEGQSTGLISFMGPLAEKALLRLPGTVYHTVSETSKEDLLLAGVKEVTVIPNGISLDDYTNIHNDNFDNLQCIYIGRLVFYKNVDTIIRAFKKVTDVFPKAKLVVVGDGPMKPKWVELVNILGLKENIHFVGRVSHEEKTRLISASSFLVHPSVVEGFGIVLLEAFACNKPALVSDVKPLTEIIDDEVDGYVIPPFSPDAWADKMILLFTDSQKAKLMGERGRKKLERFYTIPKVVDKMEAMYKRILGSKK
jgi:glycosyltransferase involved in cell wall biosynthesis